MMVLIESSQTIKIVVDKLYFKVGFDFKANSTLFSDEGNGTISNNMTLTLAITPGYCQQTGKLKVHFNSIVINSQNPELYKFELNAKTFPLMQLKDDIESWRTFLINKVNEMLKIFQQDIEDRLNQYFGNMIYSFTNSTIDADTACKLKKTEDIQLCPLAIPIKYIADKIETSPVWIWENLIDYKEKTYNPSIREDFISTRFYAMTFAPNKTNGELPNLINSTDLVYMPTYESDRKEMIIQFFISQAFINSIISSYADKGVLNLKIANKSNNILDNTWYNIVYMLYPKPKADWRLNIYLEKVSDIKITAGQLPYLCQI